MGYYYKVFTETRTGKIQIWPVMVAPSGLRSSNVKYHGGITERIRTFRTLKAARKANAADRLAARISRMPADRRRSLYLILRRKFRDNGLQIIFLTKILDLPYPNPDKLKNPWHLARLILFDREYTKLIKTVRERIPLKS